MNFCVKGVWKHFHVNHHAELMYVTGGSRRNQGPVYTSHAVPGLKKTKKQELNPATVLVWPKTCRSRFEVSEKNLTGHCKPSVKISAACVLSQGPLAQVDLCFGGHHLACLGILTGRQTLWEYVTVLSLKVLFVLYSPALREHICRCARCMHACACAFAYMLGFSDVSLFFVCREIQKSSFFTMQLALISFSMKMWKVWKGSVWYLTIRGECVVYRALEAFPLLPVSPFFPIRIR